MSITYKFFKSTSDGAFVSVEKFIDGKPELAIPLDEQNRHYQEYLQDIKTHGMSIVSCTDCGDGLPNDSMWQYVDNAEELLVNKYGSDQDKLTALREDRYVRAMEAKTPYESMNVAGSVIDNTPQIIKDKYRHLPMRR
tara:strand:+ start:1149 stop:1562 length:414 start_codon:yes stop_codon:yes gene_type:complete